MHVVISTFAEHGHAETAVAALHNAGFSTDEIGVLLRGEHPSEEQKQVYEEVANEALAGAGVGAMAGTAVGGLLGLLAGAVSIGVPGIGPILAGGMVAATLGGAAAGAVYGTLLGVVIKLGLTDENADFYTDTLTNDGVIVVVEAKGERAAHAWRIMYQAKATKTNSTILGQSQNTSISMPVIGLFPNPENAAKALARLLDEGIDEAKIHLLDAHVAQERGLPMNRYPTIFVPSPLGLNPIPAFPPVKGSDEPNVVESYLISLGIDEADAPFYLDAVRQGGALLIVKTQDKQEAIISRTVMMAMDVTQMAIPV